MSADDTVFTQLLKQVSLPLRQHKTGAIDSVLPLRSVFNIRAV